METPYAPTETFEEVWVRLHMRLEDGWDVGGPGDIIEVNSVTTGFAHVMSASIDAPSGTPTVRARARTCVTGGVNIECDGYQDWETLQELGNDPGETPLFDGAASGEWHCLVLHVRLNDPGASNGSIDVELDGEPESALEDLDLRGEVAGVGLNAIQLSAYWDGGPSEPVERYLDEIVVSDSPLGCE
jgi:hypothetical protein